MEKILLTPIILLWAFLVADARWFPQTSGTTENLHSVQFVNTSTGFVTGDNGIILKTVDGGYTWTQLNSGVTVSLYCISMISSTTGWVAGGDGTILKTQDGGLSWSPQSSGTTDPIFAIQFLNTDRGWASKFYDEILLTTNSGVTWQNRATGINNIILDLFFTDLNTGWVCGWGGTLMKTTDGGLNWAPQYSGTSITRKSLFFLDNLTGWSAGGGGAITKTTNGGTSWTALNSGALEFFNSIYFTGPDSGWVTGSEKVYVTYDGGTTWQKELDQYGKNFTDLWFESAGLGWLVGYAGTIYQYAYSPTLRVLAPNGGENYLVGDMENIQWESADVDSIRIEYSTDGGLQWMAIADRYPAVSGTYQWEIPNNPSTVCLIKISDTDSPATFDISNQPFSISRSPQIIFPDGGEYLFFNQPCDITWDDGGSQYIAIELSRDNGIHWVMIADSIPASPGSFSWVVTPPRSDQCRLKITDYHYPDFFDISSRTFVIDSLFSPYHYFPLAPGNAWYFHGWYPIQTIFEVEKDTLLSDGHVYAQLNRHDLTLWWWTWPLTRTEFVRQSGDSVLIYPDSLILDFSWQSGDTIFFSPDHFAYVDTIYVQNLFGRPLNTYIIFSSALGYYSFSDGIGYNTIPAWNNYPPRYLVGFLIDGIQYGNTIVALDENEQPGVEGYRLGQNYPNPFNGTTTIEFSIPRQEQVTITLYDISGRKVKTILNESLNPGQHAVKVEADHLTSGIYLYWMSAGTFSESKKILLIK